MWVVWIINACTNFNNEARKEGLSLGAMRRTDSLHREECLSVLLTLIPGAAELPLPNPELPEQSHVADSILHDLITAILVAIAAVIASGLLDRIWDTL